MQKRISETARLNQMTNKKTPKEEWHYQPRCKLANDVLKRINVRIDSCTAERVEMARLAGSSPNNIS
jgi:hypothetical protein